MRFAAIGAIVIMALAACNPVASIARDTNSIRLEAKALAEHGRSINDQEVVDRAERIEEHAAGIHESLSDVESKTPPWMTMVTWLAVAAAIVAGLVFLAQSGLLSAIRIAIGWIPARKLSDAELAHKMLGSDAETPREYVAARRASDPMFEAAWRKINKEKECTSSPQSNPCSDQSSSQQPASQPDTGSPTSSP